MPEKTQAEKCQERYGFTNPHTVRVECKCEGCTGYLEFDGLNIDNSNAFLMCTECGCTSVMDTTTATRDKIKQPKHYPEGMGEESRRLHREYNALVKAQLEGAKNAAEVVKLTDECNAKGIILVPGGENL